MGRVFQQDSQIHQPFANLIGQGVLPIPSKLVPQVYQKFDVED